MDPLVLIPITVIFVVAMIVGRHILVHRKVTCPRTGTVAEIEVFESSWKPDKLVRVKSCDLLDDPKVVNCGQGCILDEEAQET